MTKNEKKIILNAYESICVSESIGFDRSDARREIGFMLEKLGLEKEQYEIDNKFLAYRPGYSNEIAIDTFQMIFDSFYKYGYLVKYDIDEIEVMFEELKYEMDEHDVKYNERRISILKEKVRVYSS